jgi:hypothetical protein
LILEWFGLVWFAWLAAGVRICAYAARMPAKGEANPRKNVADKYRK